MTKQTSARYAVIDNGSGFIWGVVDAASPLAACAAVDADLCPHDGPRTYTEANRYNLLGDGFHVYVAPATFDCDDGQDEIAIAAVSDMPYAMAVAVSVK